MFRTGSVQLEKQSVHVWLDDTSLFEIEARRKYCREYLSYGSKYRTTNNGHLDIYQPSLFR